MDGKHNGCLSITNGPTDFHQPNRIIKPTEFHGPAEFHGLSDHQMESRVNAEETKRKILEQGGLKKQSKLLSWRKRRARVSKDKPSWVGIHSPRRSQFSRDTDKDASSTISKKARMGEEGNSISTQTSRSKVADD